MRDDEPFRFWPDHNPPTWAEHFAEHLTKKLEHIVASISDLTAITAQVSDNVTRVAADYDALKNAVSGVTSLSPDDQAALDAAVANLGGSVASLQSADPAPEVPPVV